MSRLGYLRSESHAGSISRHHWSLSSLSLSLALCGVFRSFSLSLSLSLALSVRLHRTVWGDGSLDGSLVTSPMHPKSSDKSYA